MKGLTDRLSRFSKIAGEMVPHGRIEEALQGGLREGSYCVVAALPDEQKGERLVLLHTDAGMPAEEALETLGQAGLPKLWQPKRDAIF